MIFRYVQIKTKLLVPNPYLSMIILRKNRLGVSFLIINVILYCFLFTKIYFGVTKETICVVVKLCIKHSKFTKRRKIN